MEENMSIDQTKELNDLWHEVNMRMKAEMSSGKYQTLSGISMVELSILQVVEIHPSCMLKEIGNQLDLPKSTLTSAINRLEMKNLVKRTPSKEDKRAYNLELTPDGLQAQIEHRKIENIVFSELLQNLTVQERTIFLKLFFKLVCGKEK